jgi:UDP-glucose 4-epimerase
MKYFITGGAGFIGSHMVEYLAADHHNTVAVYDNFSAPGARDVLKNDFTYRDDLLHVTGLFDALRQFQPDVVIHLAANTDIPSGRLNPQLDFDNCIKATWNLLEAMRELGLRRLLFASTAAVYGDTESTCAECLAPLYPISHYGAAKLACEAMISGFAHLHNIQASIFRFANVVGGGMDHGVIYDLIQKLKRTPNELRVWGDGKGCKPFFLVDDCIWGIVSVLHAMDATAGSVQPCDIFNLGPRDNIPISQVVDLVVHEMLATMQIVRPPKVVYEGGRHGFPGDVPTVRFSNMKMNTLGWKPRYSSEEAVRIAAFRIIDGRR